MLGIEKHAAKKKLRLLLAESHAARAVFDHLGDQLGCRGGRGLDIGKPDLRGELCRLNMMVNDRNACGTLDQRRIFDVGKVVNVNDDQKRFASDALCRFLFGEKHGVVIVKLKRLFNAEANVGIGRINGD